MHVKCCAVLRNHNTTCWLQSYILYHSVLTLRVPGITYGAASWHLANFNALSVMCRKCNSLVHVKSESPAIRNSSTLSTQIRVSGEALLEFRIPVTEVHEFQVTVGTTAIPDSSTQPHVHLDSSGCATREARRLYRAIYRSKDAYITLLIKGELECVMMYTESGR